MTIRYNPPIEHLLSINFTENDELCEELIVNLKVIKILILCKFIL